VVLALPAELGASIGAHTQQRSLVFLEEGQDAVVECFPMQVGILKLAIRVFQCGLMKAETT